jgi:hypothetical protein
LPLKREKGFKLEPLGEVEVKDRPAVGIRVLSKGHRDINLYFDKKTHQVVKTERRVIDDNGMEVSQENFLTPGKGPGLEGTRLTIHRDGKLFIEAEVTTFTPAEKLDDSIFAEP